MTPAEISSLVASLISVCIGILAIWLSVIFYRMSSQLSESTKEAAKDISASVERLEKLFDKLYSDTFSMMRDTVSDMRRHMWPEETKPIDGVTEEIEKRADDKISVIKEEIDNEIVKLLEKQSSMDAKVESIRDELKVIVSRAINESRRVEIEAREETLREAIITELKIFQKTKKYVRVSDLLESLQEKTQIDLNELAIELFKMREDEIIVWIGSKDRLNSKILLRLK